VVFKYMANKGESMSTQVKEEEPASFEIGSEEWHRAREENIGRCITYGLRRLRTKGQPEAWRQAEEMAETLMRRIGRTYSGDEKLQRR